MKYVYFLVAAMFSLQGVAQTDLENKIAQLEQKLKEQTERNTVLKEALDLRHQQKVIKKNDVTIRITSLSQDLGSGIVSVQGLIAYHGASKRNLQFVQQQIVDLKGNSYETYKVVKPKDQEEEFFLEDVTPDVPYSFVIKFEGIKDKLATVSVLSVQIYGEEPGTVVSFGFRSLEVEW